MLYNHSAILADSEWNTRTLLDEYQGENALLVRKSQLQAQFTSKGELTGEIVFLINGDEDAVRGLFKLHGLNITLSHHGESWYRGSLAPAMKSID